VAKVWVFQNAKAKTYGSENGARKTKMARFSGSCRAYNLKPLLILLKV